MLASFSWIVNLTETRIELKPHDLKPHLWHYSVLSFKEKQQEQLVKYSVRVSWHVWNPKMSALKAFLSFLLQELVLNGFKAITRHHLTSLKNNILLSARTRVSPQGPVSWKFQKGVLYVCRQVQRFHNFEQYTICLSLNLKAKLTGLWARNYGTVQQVLILKFAFGPEKLPGLSRNRPLDGDKYRSFIGA